ncbi:phosphate starvation-inducible protein PhoH [Devosia sp. Root413D1]|uniref:PhoH family protein n=1 Tax=Devosia sp. LjRoot16 TaxID=3342271 RepID=UPI0006F29BF5|nr:phosphate starvation-inducible protein PhoH [Devosia sp. Root105]KQW85968.1 phosphate starvation-inducible protein PhoH [Devosia sp. Root413D1]MBN9362382.1 PhoH family protein [Devosia sp.]ODS82570.1 MAG: phosphate starvation-inducible protein PhoH [Devosia sp. SCN 66-27]OJX24384.1 MAG: phosphate starvation-inducible protein PhoH [Devosia sp. 66-14]
MSRHLPPSTDHGPSSQLELAFEDNKLAAQLYGDFDQHLALIEQRLSVQATPRGNHVMLKGGATSVDQARRVLESLYEQLEEGQQIEVSTVDGVIRMIETEDSQLSLPTLEKKGRVRMAQIATRKATIVARTPAQDAYMRAMDRSELVFGVGPAGTGKTYLAVAHAATLLERGDINRIILSRPAVEAGERLGFLPGDMKDKVDPYLRPLYDALYDMMRPEHVERCITSGIIEVAPLAFMRGRTLANAVVILDEAQNTTSMQMKMFLTRLGENSKMIVTGDPTQVDLPRGEKSGLIEAVHLLDGVEGVHISRFNDKDVVRHALVGRIVRAYEADTARRLAENNTKA